MQKPKYKFFYSYVKSKYKFSTAIPLLYDNDKDKTITSDFETASFFNRSFTKVLKKDNNYQSFELAQKL